MALSTLADSKFQSMRWEERLDHFALQIMTKGFKRPWQIWAPHIAHYAANYGGFFAVFGRQIWRLLFGRVSEPAAPGRAGDKEDVEKERQAKQKLASLLFAKFLVWQHLAEAIGCRQGPIGGHFGLPNNWKYRLSLGTIKVPLLPFVGKRRTIVDLVVHSLFFVSGLAFLQAKEYNLKYIRALCACDVWICLSDLSQFFASTGHAYFSMLLSACFPANQGRLAGIQTALIMQWFFSGVGKIGPWFTYVNAPFMLQSKVFSGASWLFKLLVNSPTDLSPTTFGKVFAHTAASVEYLAPLALMIPRRLRRAPPASAKPGAASAKVATGIADESSKEEALVPVDATRDQLAKAGIWLGLVGITAMHVYILGMPAPFDVYSWNTCYALSGVYLFWYANFGFDHGSAAEMNPLLKTYLVAECALCWYGQFFPDQVGYYLSHRYWAGNWVQTIFFARKSGAVMEKLRRVKVCNDSPRTWGWTLPFAQGVGESNFAYLWLATFNMKAFLGLAADGVQTASRIYAQANALSNGELGGAVGNAGVLGDYVPIGLTQLCCGEFRDSLYTTNILETMQEQIGFDSGECFMLRLGAFGLGRSTATWGLYDMKDGWIKKGLRSASELMQMHAFPTESIAALS